MEAHAAVIEKAGDPFTFRDIEFDDPRNDEVLVRVVATGVCQTDAHIRKQEYKTPLPMVLGHEGAGVVEAVGDGVTGLKPGDHVVMSYPYCGHCRYCLTGHPAFCEQGFDLSFQGMRADGTNAYHDGVHGHFFGQSSFATYSLANQNNVIKVPDEAPLELLGPLGCGFQTGAGTILTALQIPAGSSVAVVGAGGVGLASVMAAKVAGATTIIAMDLSDERLALAAELGATHTFNTKDADITEKLLEVTDGGVDYAVELTGVPKILSATLEGTAMLGTVAQVAGPPMGTKADLDVNTILNGRGIRGYIQGDAVSKQFIPTMVKLYLEGEFPFDKLTKMYDFTDIEQAFDDSASGKTIKPILKIGEF